MVNTRRKQYGSKEVLQQHRMVALLKHYSQEELQHMTIASTPNGDGIHLRWHDHPRDMVDIPALQLLAIAGHAVSQPPEQMEGDAVEDAAEEDDVTEDDMAEDDAMEEGSDDESEYIDLDADVEEAQVARDRSPTEPVEGYYDPSPVRRGGSVDAFKVNGQHCVGALQRLVADNIDAMETYAKACEAGVFDGLSDVSSTAGDEGPENALSPAGADWGSVDGDEESESGGPTAGPCTIPQDSPDYPYDMPTPRYASPAPLETLDSYRPSPYATPGYDEWVAVDPIRRAYVPGRGAKAQEAPPEFLEGSSSGRPRRRGH